MCRYPCKIEKKETKNEQISPKFTPCKNPEEQKVNKSFE